ncbi:MAG: beta-phosphoglucomutase [Bacteroidota bacterium]|nr:beta-phosphoglucomutase [Bacteroidota bacterium]
MMGFIFDLDGVIVDTARFHYKAWRDLAAEWGYSLTYKDNEQLKGVSRMNSIQKIADWAKVDLPKDELERMSDIKNEYYLNLCDSLGIQDVLPGVLLTIQECAKRDIKIADGSASKNAKIVLNKLGICHLFDTIVDGTMVRYSKPNPEVFIQAANNLNLPASSCVVFEDAQAGIEASKSAGMFAVGVGFDLLKNSDKQINTFKNFDIDDFIDGLQTISK